MQLRQRYVAIVDDDRLSAIYTRAVLAPLALPTLLAPSARAAQSLAACHPLALAVLDIALPDFTGFDLAGHLRASQPDVAVLFVSGYTDLRDRQRAFACGASGFVSKPFVPAELLQQARYALQSRAQPSTFVWRVDDITGDMMLPDGRRIPLTPTEARIADLLVRANGQELARAEICRALWERRDPVSAFHALDAHLRRLRAKIELDPLRPRYLHLSRGTGVRLQP